MFTFLLFIIASCLVVLVFRGFSEVFQWKLINAMAYLAIMALGALLCFLIAIYADSNFSPSHIVFTEISTYDGLAFLCWINCLHLCREFRDWRIKKVIERVSKGWKF